MDLLFRQIDNWYAGPLGQQVLQAEQLIMAPWLKQCFGEYFLQIGGGSRILSYDQCAGPMHIRLSPESAPYYSGPSVQSDWHDLPLLPNTMDAVLLAHVLEHAEYPQHLLEEVYRVLVPEGQVCILSFNPYSLWGLAKLCDQTQVWPWRGRFWSAWRLRRWLLQAGFTILEHKTVFFRLPLQHRRWQRWLRVLEPVGQLCCPYFGAVNVLIAKKAVLATVREQPVLQQKRANVALRPS